MLKWRYTSRDEGLVPLSITCWPSASGSEMYVNLEYESGVSYDLRGVEVAVPLPGSGAPTVNQVRSRRGTALGCAGEKGRGGGVWGAGG